MEHVVAWIMDHDGSLITMATLSMEHIAIEDIEHDVDRNTNTNTSTTTRLYWYYSSIHIYNNNTLLIPNNTSVTSNSPLVGGLLISPHASRIIYLLTTETLPNSSTSAAERGWQLAATGSWMALSLETK